MSFAEFLESRRLFSVLGLDSSFGKSGSASVKAGSLIDPLPNGQILVGARVGNTSEVSEDVLLQRVNSNGSLDSSFGSGGAVRIAIASDLTLGEGDSSSRLYALYNLNKPLAAIQARTLDGALDTTFSRDGKATLPLPAGITANDVSPLALIAAPDGGLFVQLKYYTSTSNEYQIAKLTRSGAIDASFGKNGFLDIDEYDTLVDASTRGLYLANSGSHTLQRYLPNGSGPDRTFVKVTRLASATILGEQADGRVIYTAHASDYGSVLTIGRLTATGKIDTTFGNAGTVALPNFYGAEATFDPQGRILGFSNGKIYRYSADGLLDAAPFDGSANFDAGTIAFDSSGDILSGSSHLLRYGLVSPIQLGSDHKLQVTGDDSNDVVSIFSAGNGRVGATLNGQTLTFSAASVTSMNLLLGNGDNTVSVSYDLPTSIITGSGNDTITTGNEDDGIDAGSGSNTISMGNGRDSVLVSGSDPNEENITGGDGSKSIFAYGGYTNIRLGTGDSSISVYGNTTQANPRYTANVSIAGGNNNLTIRTQNATVNIGGNGANTIDAFRDFERTGFGRAIITTGDGADTIRAEDDDNVFSGGGNDTISVVGTGIDSQDDTHPVSLNGGAGDDTISVGNEYLRATIDGGDGNDSISGNAGEQTIYGGNGNDYIFGGGDKYTRGIGDDVLYGQNGDDTIVGSEANDFIDGGNGNDSLDGGAGNDTLWGDAGNDTLDGGTQSDTLYGGAGNDLLVSYDKFVDRVYGEAGTNKGDVDASDKLTDIQQLK